MSNNRFSLVIYACLIGLLLVSCCLRVFRLGEFPPGISRDEATNLVDGAYLSQSGRLPLFQDHERPEPFNRIYGALTSIFFGNSVWAFRYTSALWGMLSLAAVFWASQRCFAAQPRRLRLLVGLLALASLAPAMGHIAISRSIYRAVPLVSFAAFAAGFTCRALRRHRLSDYVRSGICLALGCYTYTAALALPLAYLPLAVHLAVLHRSGWRRWLPGLLATAVVLFLLTLPIVYLLLVQPDAILARASDVVANEGEGWIAQIRQVAAQLLIRGDQNPQYNVASAPLISGPFVPFFLVGFAALALQLRQPASIIVLSLLVACALPTMLTDETNGLRSYVLYAVVPIVTGAGIIPLFWLIKPFPRLTRHAALGCLIGIAALGIYSAVNARRTYAEYWLRASADWQTWRIHDLELSHSEWFFRTDKKFLADWIIAQDKKPLLIPLLELDHPILRALLMPAFPLVGSMPANFELPPQTRLIVPWSLARGAYLERADRLALLLDETITALPPLTDDEKLLLLSEQAGAFELIMPDSAYPAIARIQRAPADWSPQVQLSAGDGLLARFNGELNLRGYKGPDTIAGAGRLEYELAWAVGRPVSHEYGAFLQLLDRDFEVIAGQDRHLWRWLHPTVLWPPGQPHSQLFSLAVERQLPPGAYRLVAGAWHTNGRNLAAESFVGLASGRLATIGWVKAPQPQQPAIPDEAVPLSYEFAGAFRLRNARVKRADDGLVKVELFWEALQSRPDYNASVFLHAVDEQGEIVSQSDMLPWDGRYPTFIWDAGEVVATSHQLQIPRADGIELMAGMYQLPQATRLAAWSKGERLPDDIARLGAVIDLLAN